MSKGTLFFFCGKMGAGKTTKSRELAEARNAVWVSEDEWLEAVYPQKIASIDDYIKYSALVRPPMKNLVQSMLTAGINVVMDYPANTIQQRSWFRSIFSEVHAPHKLIYIDLPNDLCIERIAKRRAEHPERATTDTAEMFEKVTKYFVAPTSDEGFNSTVISENA